jgi:modulator of FtsH protease
MVANIFLHIPALQLALAVVFALISGGFILYQTNMIVRGGETNYISATIILYISILRIFLTLLQLLGAFGGNRN